MRPSISLLEPIRLCTLATLAVLLLGGCGNRVIVHDSVGRPVQNASVKVCYPSFSGPTVATDRSGIADLGFGQPDVYSLTVSKDGYTTQCFYGPQKWPHYVILDIGSIQPSSDP